MGPDGSSAQTIDHGHGHYGELDQKQKLRHVKQLEHLTYELKLPGGVQ